MLCAVASLGVYVQRPVQVVLDSPLSISGIKESTGRLGL